MREEGDDDGVEVDYEIGVTQNEINQIDSVISKLKEKAD